MTIFLSLAFLSTCNGILLTGTIIFFYISISKKNPLYTAILISGISSFMIICCEIFSIISSLSGEIYIGMQVHRIQALLISTAIFVVPFINQHLLDLNDRLKKINRTVYIAGLCFIAILVFSAFVFPDSFLSFSKKPGSVATPWNAARATPMFMYRVRDVVIALAGFYSLALLLFEIKLSNGYRRLRFILIGFLIAIVLGALDLVFQYLEMETGVLSKRIFLFSNIGFTAFTILSMISIVNIFNDQEHSLEVAKRNENWGLLAGGIAHDFNNFLNGILGYTSLAMLEVKEGELTAQYLAEIKKASELAKNIISQLMAFSRAKELKREAVSLQEFVREIAQFALIDSNVSATYNFASGLHNAFIDKSSIFQVIQNLITNAVQAMPKGGSIEINADNYTKTIDTNTLKAGRYLKISFRDNGIGIPKKNLQLIFEPYFSSKKEGTGLGLAITYNQIKKHNGHIEVASELGKGTTFNVYLPAADDTINVIQ